MSKVVITKAKLDALANVISAKSGESIPLTLDEMAEAVESIQTGGGGDDTFLITLSYNQTDDVWESDKTISEIMAAYEADKDIACKCDDPSGTAGNLIFDTSTPCFIYDVSVYGKDSSNNNICTVHTYNMYENLIYEDHSITYRVTVDATATAAEVANGSTFFTSTGFATGSATRRSSSDLAVSGATVTAPAGYYASSASTSVSSMTLPTSAAASATSGYSSKATIGRSTSDQYINIPTGYNSSGAYYKVSAVANGSAGTPTATKGTVSNHQVSITPSVTNTTGYITGSTKTGTAVTVSASELDSGTKSITANGTGIDVVGYATVDVAVSGGGSGAKIGTATATPSSASASISFTGLSGEPTSFAIVSAADLATGASPYKSSAVVFDGTNIHGQYITNTSNANMTASDSAFSKSYSNGTLTVTGTGTNFQANQYKLMYSYDGSSSNVGTSDVQVGSGATSITFANLPDEPTAWSCVFKSNIGTSSGYTRALVIVNDGTSIYGMEMGSAAQAEANWSESYSNGSLTISSQSTSAGGYFHQPGYYQLTYVIGGEISVDIEPLTVTQNGTYSESGKAYSPVVVTVSGGGGANFGTVTMSNSSNQATSIDFTLPSGRTPKAFFARLTSQIARNSNSRYYYVYDMRWDGSSSGGVAGNTFYMYNGTLTNVTSGYGHTQSGTTFTLSTTGSRSASPGSFFNGTYELVYVY